MLALRDQSHEPHDVGRVRAPGAGGTPEQWKTVVMMSASWVEHRPHPASPASLVEPTEQTN